MREIKKMETKKRSTFTSKIGFVLAAAGSAVGLGNIWRFPYLAAKYGGGSFLLVYLILAATFGYTMIMAESALGRMTGRSPVGAYRRAGAGKVLMTGGWFNAVIPLLIVPYYSVIGGWVCKYLFEYIRGSVHKLAGENYFSDFISSGKAPWQSAWTVEFWFAVFAVATMVVIFFGVQNGIERVSKVMMPVLVLLCLVIVIYSVTRPGAGAGVKYFLVPDFKRFSWMTVVAALGQMFYSLSIAMGILITFGSYMKKDVDIEKSTTQVEIFDTLIAVMAGLMVIPAVFAFSEDAGRDLQSGPSLMFVMLPKVFDSMGGGTFIGIVFFLMVLFAALTSSVALAESVVSTFEDELHWSRGKASVVTGIIILLLGTLSCFGFNVLSRVTPLNMDFLDFFDFLTNSVMMPIAAIATCVLVMKPDNRIKIESEIKSSSKFRRRGIYRFVLKYLAIIFLLVILISSVLNAFGVIHI